MDNNIDTINISDLASATALVCEGIFPVNFVKDPSSPKIEIVFPLTKKTNQTIEAFWLGKHKCVSREYYQNLKMLKNRIYSLKNNGE